MKNLISRSMSILAAFALIFGSHFNAQASSAATTTLLVANQYYVSVTGSDTNPGTQAAPFNTISKAMSVALAGDLIYVRAGTYPAFSVAKSGLTISGYNSELPLISGGTGIRCSNKSNITIKGFEVTGASGSWIGAIMLDNCSNVVVSGNKVHDNIASTVSGIAVSGSNNKILNNEIYNNNFSGVRLSGTSLNNEIGFNRIYNHTLSTNDSDGIDLADATVTQTNIHDNTIFGNSDDGIDTWSSPGNTITNNVAYRNGGTGDGNGFKLGGNATGGNNRVVGNVSYSNLTCGFTSNGNGNYYEGNTSYNNGSCGFNDSWRNAGNTQPSSYINNLAYNNPGGNFKKSSYVTVFTGNSETLSTAVAPSAVPTITALPSLTATPTSVPTLKPTSTIPAATITAAPTNTPTSIPPTATATLVVVPASPTNTQIINPPTATPTELFVPAAPTNTPTSNPPTATSTIVVVPASPTNTQIVNPPTATSTAVVIPASPTPTLVITSAPPTAIPTLIHPSESGTVFDDKSYGLVYSSGWRNESNRRAYKNSYMFTTRNGSSMTFAFTGQAFSVIYKGGTAFGKFDVYIDNILVGTIDEKTPASAFQQRWDYPGLLTSGPHTLKLVFVTSDPSVKNFGSIDAVIIR